MTAMTNIAAASMASTPSSRDTVGVTALNKPARKISVVYVNGLARLAAWIAEGAKEDRAEEQRPRDEERALPGRGEACAQHGKREAKHEEGAGDPDDQRREDDAQDVLSAGEGPHQELLEHSVLPVEPELRPRVRAPVDDGQRHS